MRRDVYSLDFPTTISNGAALRVADLTDKWLQVVGLTGTANLEGTIDGATWVVLAALANGLAAVTAGVVSVRVARTGVGAGTAKLAGLARSSE